MNFQCQVAVIHRGNERLDLTAIHQAQQLSPEIKSFYPLSFVKITHSKIISCASETERIAISGVFIFVFTYLSKMIPSIRRWAVMTKIFFQRSYISRITLTNSLITICIDNSIGRITRPTDSVRPSFILWWWIPY